MSPVAVGVFMLTVAAYIGWRVRRNWTTTQDWPSVFAATVLAASGLVLTLHHREPGWLYELGAVGYLAAPAAYVLAGRHTLDERSTVPTPRVGSTRLPLFEDRLGAVPLQRGDDPTSKVGR